VAVACLRSVPLARQSDKLQVRGIKSWLQFQSTLAYLKDPPPGHLYPAVDIMAALDDVEDKLDGDYYSNEYDVQLDIFRIVSSGYDGHLVYIPDIMRVFTFVRNISLVSISEDGVSLPDVYQFTDIAALINGDDVSPIARINGQDVEAFVNEQATMNGRYQDPDANYNSVFPNVPKMALQQSGTTGVFTASDFYQGDSTNITFQDGTTMADEASAVTSQDFSGIRNGQDFFDKFCTGAQAVSSPIETAVPTSTSDLKPLPTTYVSYTSLPTGSSDPRFSPQYPRPLTAARDNSVAGYLPQGEDYAVLSIPSFYPQVSLELLDRAIVDWQNVVRETIATAQARGRRRLIIDLRGNGGGILFLAYDLLKQLFPDLTPYGASNLAAFDLFNDVGKVLSEFNEDVTTDNVAPDDQSAGFATIVDYTRQVDEDKEGFTGWEDFYGPVERNGGRFTNLVRYNLSDYYQTMPVQVSGYINNTQSHEAPFTANDVVLLQDGTCASTCALFSEFMKTQAGARQIVVGGRRQDGPMQGIGGTKGANSFSFNVINSFVLLADILSVQTSFGPRYVTQTHGDIFNAVTQAYRRAAFSVVQREALAGVNMRNNIRQDDESATPLQFVYEAADCRFFFTPEMYDNQSAVWSYAHSAMWDDSSMCIERSTGAPSS
ncbi:hypothetical protein K431DRAFT_204161, partial [Polychaeton citri CBS 116435]